VTVREDVPGEKRLVAYVVPAEEGGISGAGLREELGARLPEHLVPGAFVVLESLPLTSHGKVDRRALPAPEPGPEPGSEYVAPRTPTEEVLAGTWAEVLGVERVGTAEDFFALGGHSLLATRVVARARQAFGVEVPLRAFFEAPTVAALAALVEELRGAGVSPAPPMERASRAEPLPLSFAQQRLWLVDRIEPGSPAYNMHFPLRLRGPLDAAALRAGLDALVARHETLRTVFAEHDGLPVQVVHAPAPAALSFLDLQGVPEAEREAERLADAEALRPFDLARGPLLRCTLLRLAEDDHVLCLTMHHVVSDGWSMQVLVREVSEVYAAYSRGEEARLPELPVQYADFAVWQRAWLSGDTLAERIGFWKEKLAGAPLLLEVATDHPREAGQSPLAASHPVRLSPELSRGLRALSRREGTTLFMTVLAAWQALLSRYSGQADVTVGTPVAGRTRTELEGLIGFFVNMLVLRGDLGGDPAWSELLARTRDAALGAYEHQELPFERLVEDLGVQRSLLHSPVFQTTFALEPAGPGGERREPGPVRLEPFGGGERAAKFDLDLAMLDDGATLGGAIVYRRALFEPETIARMAGHLETVLETMAADPAGRLSGLSLLRGAERTQVLEAWNATAAVLPRACVHELFAGQAAHTPGAVAVVAGDETVTYAELERRANRLAHLLRGRGAGPETRVGVCLERGIPAVVALLAVLKAGGAYVPVAPSDPAERLREIFADAGVRLVLSELAVGAHLPDAVEPLWLDAPETAAELAAMPETAPVVPSDPAQLAYVIYTSGSTGRPKGVAVAHASVVRLVRGTNYVPFGPEERIAHASNLAFDAATFEVWGALLNGGSLAVVERETTLSPAALAAALRERGVTALFVTTALFNRVAHEEPEAFATLRHLLFGGEAVDPQAVRRVLETGAPGRLLHVYGPTETTTYASWQRVREVAPDAATVPIGAGLGNTTLYVLAAGGEAQPAGIPGELYIGGAGLARGYLGQPGMTAERFVPDPFGDVPGARLYRTGDRVRWTAAGEIEYLGRMDQQVKIRGFRIEPAEVEAVLTGLPEVREAVVAVREDAPGEKRLAAYVVAADGAEVTEAGLRAQLAARLPEYLVPGAVVVLESLPLNANGKVDRAALPAPQWGSGAEYVAPRTATEEVLAGIWAEVLKLERVGVEASFFDLGGHSLLATQVVSRARLAFGTEVPLRDLFEAPTVAGLARRIEALRSAGVEAAPPMERVERTGPMPVSFAQQRLWVVDRLEPGSATYNMPYALRLRGALDVGALRGSLDALVERHETLRTVFAEQEGRPVQVIHPPALVALTELDLRDRPEAEREAAAERLAAEEGLFPFDLAQGPLLRSTLLRLGEQDHVLCFTLHHVVSDGWSMQVLVREVSALYAAFSRREKPRLPELPVQYADFAVWQREWLQGEVLEAQIGYWKTQLSGAPPLLEVPTDRPRGKGNSPHAARQHFEVPPETSRALRALSRREGTTLFMTVLAAWKSLLARYSGQDDLVVGSPIAGRNRREIEGLIGFFVNMLALRADLSGDPTWAELLGRVRETALAAYDHQELPFERLVEELAVERSLVHTPVFQVIYSLNRAGGREERLSLDEMRLEPFGRGAETTKFDLNLSVLDGEDWLAAALAYRTGLFDAETAARMAGHLEVILETMAAEPERRVSETSLLRGSERTQLLHDWNGADTGYTGELCIHELVLAQVQRTPEAPALRFEEWSLTYAELYAGASQLANRLRREGVGPDVRVGVCMEPAPEMVVAVLGVLLAGGAYLPLDPELPPERRAYMLGDAAPALLLTQAALAERMEGCSVPLLLVDAEAASLAGESAQAPQTGVDPDNLAYVIYTSGSTGTPKAVLVTHRGLSNYLAWFDRTVLGAEGFVLPLVSRISFDAHVRQLFPPLLRGEPVWVLPKEAATDPAALLAAISSHERVSFGGVPSLWSAMLDLVRSGEAPAPHGLVAVLLGGEALSPELAERTFAAFPEVALLNHYGPTEATVNTTVARVRPFEPVSIGRPVGNVRVYLLDAHGALVPVGVPGELYVGGAGVSRGYLGRPGLTAEKFVPDPFSGEPGARMYRSGDQVRWRVDGELEYVGRVDFQVKVRGFRIELGEIEAVLRGHPHVKEAVVLLREDAPGQQRLVAYVTAQPGAEPTATELRARAAERVPEYMVPGDFVVLDQLPVTANGKVDRRALPAPERTEEGAYVAPRTVVEELLVGIWAEVLGAQRVGANENFFELGGHSLLVTRVVSRIRQIFGVEVQVRAVFEAPTVATMAERVEALRSAGATLAPAIERVPRTDALPVSFAQQRLWLVDRMEPGSVAYNMPYALHLHGALDVAAMRATLDELVRRHEALRTVFAERGGVPVQVIRDPAPVPLPVVDLRGVMDAEGMPGRLVDDEAMRPFDLERGPLLRSMLLRLGDGHHALCFTMHHIVSDGWSRSVLVHEVSALYSQFSRGGEARLPEPPVQYADYAVWQRNWLTGEVLDAQIEYWKTRLSGAPPLLEVATDRPRAVGLTPHAARHGFVLSVELSNRLRALSRQQGATLFMTLLAGWQALLARYSGQEDLVVGSPIAGRTRPEVERLIGFFVNMLALRADLSGDPTWTELLERVRAEMLRAYDHQELPFERLVEELGVERSLTHAPVFQTIFTLNLPFGSNDRLELGNLRIEPFDGGSDPVAKFDLDMVFSDGAEALGGTLVYRRALFDAGTVERMAEHLVILLEAMAADPESRLSGLSLLHGAERDRVLEAWNETAVELPRACVHELFAEQAARTPGAPAVVAREDTLTYAELERRADRLAHLLRTRGVGPETRAGIFLERTPEMVVAMLAVLRAGGAYVPLDPAYPDERLHFMLADAGAAAVVTSAALAGRIGGFAGAVVRLDGEERDGAEDAGAVPHSGTSALSHSPSPENLAYVVYTSGSTGTPKGVAVTHGALLNLVHWHRRAFALTGDDRATQLAGLGFDASVWELWPYLASGAAVHLVADEETRSSPAALQAFLLEREVTVAFAPTPMAEALLALEWPAEAPLRLLLTGGDALRGRPREGLPFELVNNYGPTENTVVTTSGVVSPVRGSGRAPAIGRPIGNVRVYVLDAHLAPVPVGVPGELCAGGAQVARGYLGRAELTAERFVPDAYGAAGGRLYRTGDRVRWTAAGELEYLGRIDQQVKIRGFRIEPGEVEAALLAHEAVREAVVVVREDAAFGEPGEKRLVAYVVAAEGAQPGADELRAALRGRLPEHMVPGAFVVLEQLPLTASGKVDRRALPRPQSTDLERAEGSEAPRDGLEESIAAIFAEVLGVAGVGVHDSFFELGGHSLLAVQLMSRLKEATGVRVPVAALFKAPTVERLAEEVRHGGGATSLLVPMRFVGSRAPLFLVHPGGGNVMAYVGLVKELGADQPVFGLRSRGIEYGEKPNWTVAEMARDYLAAIREVKPSGPYRLGGWSLGGVIAFEMARQLEAAGETVEPLLLIDSRSPRLDDPDGSTRSSALQQVRRFAEDLGLPGDRLPLPEEDQGDADEVVYLREVLVAARVAGLVPEALDLARMQHLYGIFKINLQAMQQYQPEGYGGRVVLLRARKRTLSQRLFRSRTFGWERVAPGGVEVLPVPGTHHSMLREPHVAALAREVERALG
jgi:amino acid adenylation domain-containing protein